MANGRAIQRDNESNKGTSGKGIGRLLNKKTIPRTNKAKV